MSSPTAPRALVAGGSGGIGRAIAVGLAEAGWDIALTYRNNKDAGAETADLVRAAGRQASIHGVDLVDAAAARGVVTGIGAQGPLAAVVYAAGPHIPMRFISELSPETFSDTIDQDLKACFNFLQPSLPLLRPTKGAVLAIVTPVISRYTRKDIMSVTPKAAVQALIRGIASEEGRYGVRANAIGVGVIEGQGMWDELIARGDFTEAGLNQALADTALKRFGRVDDIANAATFLLSDRSSWITGQTLYVDGGYSV
jgi:NAD(P)-dependent dehydrogenase (short-subunit alcohol dehydrogenase family)